MRRSDRSRLVLCLALIAFLFCSTQMFAANEFWVETLGPGNVVINDMVVTSDGGYAFTGSVPKTDTPSQHRLVAGKIDKTGDLVWAKAYDTADARGMSIDVSSDGSYVVAGTGSAAGGTSYLILLMLMDDGTITWQRTFMGVDGTNAQARRNQTMVVVTRVPPSSSSIHQVL